MYILGLEAELKNLNENIQVLNDKKDTLDRDVDNSRITHQKLQVGVYVFIYIYIYICIYIFIYIH